MHELSIAQSMIDVILEQLSGQPDGVKVTRVRIAVGQLSGVIPPALQSAFASATQGTAVQGGILEIDERPVRIWCPKCQSEQPALSPQSLRCTTCHTLSQDVRSGRELELLELTLVDPEPAG